MSTGSMLTRARGDLTVSEQVPEGQLTLFDLDLADWGEEDEEEDDLYPYSWDIPKDCE